MRPAIARLVGEVPVRLRQGCGIDNAIGTFCRLEAIEFVTQQLAQCVRGINRAINHHVRDMDTLRGEFGVQCLAQHPPPTHCGGVAVLSGIAAHCRS